MRNQLNNNFALPTAGHFNFNLQVHHMTPRIIAAIVLLSVIDCAASGQTVTSPDGKIAVALILDSGTLSYTVSYDGTTFLEPSPLGLETSIGSFASGLVETGAANGPIDERYRLPHGKVNEVHYVANELVASYKNARGDTLEVHLRVSDRDVAFAYKISSSRAKRVVIERELTGFNFPKFATAYVTPQARWGEGFAASKPSYEEGYRLDTPINTKSKRGLGYTFPALFRIGDEGWVLLSETGVTSRYAGTRLSDPTSEGLYTISFPAPAENAGVGDATVSASLPVLTSWKTITLGTTLKPIVETTVTTDVVKPLYEPEVDYEPGRATWSWILWQDQSMNERDQRTFINLASAMGYEYILIDALWDQRIGREKMAKMVEYAKSKNVDVLLWYNSNGSWNDAPQSPRDRMDTAPARQREMAWLQSIGAKGLKVDFFGGDKQTTMKLYEDILTDANRYGLMLNFHGATLPRGWERMYPNHMTSEAVTASENLVFSQGFADGEARLSTILPFIRNPVAAMDYGPVFLNKRFSRDPNRGNQRRTTDAFQLATAVLYHSPIQHFGITPNNLQEQPEHVIRFLREVPAVWQDTRFVEGNPGEYVVIARQNGGRWYVAATHAGDEPRELDLSLPWLTNESFTLIHDNPDGSAGEKTTTTDNEGRVRLTLEPFGGAILISD